MKALPLLLCACLTAGCASAGRDASAHLAAAQTGIQRADAGLSRAQVATARTRTLSEQIDDKTVLLLNGK